MRLGKPRGSEAAERRSHAGGRRRVPGIFHERDLSEVRRAAADEAGVDRASGPAKLRAEAMEKLEWIRRHVSFREHAPVWRAPGGEAAGLCMVGATQIRERTAGNLAVAREMLAGSAAGILAVEVGWYITRAHAANPQRRGLGDSTTHSRGRSDATGLFLRFRIGRRF